MCRDRSLSADRLARPAASYSPSDAPPAVCLSSLTPLLPAAAAPAPPSAPYIPRHAGKPTEDHTHTQTHTYNTHKHISAGV